MAKVEVINVQVLDNPSPFLAPFKFDITFDCLEALAKDIEWKVIYVGSASTSSFDQVLDDIVVGPVPTGRHMFTFEVPHPNIAKLPKDDALGVTVVMITCSYREAEFVRIGYYVNNEYGDEQLKEFPPEIPEFDKVERNILAQCPRVTKFKINWENDIAPEQLDPFGVPHQELTESEIQQFSINGAINFEDLDLYPQAGKNPTIPVPKAMLDAAMAIFSQPPGLQPGDINMVQDKYLAQTEEEPMV